MVVVVATALDIVMLVMAIVVVVTHPCRSSGWLQRDGAHHQEWAWLARSRLSTRCCSRGIQQQPQRPTEEVRAGARRVKRGEILAYGRTEWWRRRGVHGVQGVYHMCVSMCVVVRACQSVLLECPRGERVCVYVRPTPVVRAWAASPAVVGAPASSGGRAADGGQTMMMACETSAASPGAAPLHCGCAHPVLRWWWVRVAVAAATHGYVRSMMSVARL